MPTPNETRLAAVPKAEAVALAARAARRIAPLVARMGDHCGPEAIEWFNAIDQALNVVDRWERVSRFTLDLAAEIARGTANSAANSVRLLGRTPFAEDAELAFAATAFAADAARSGEAARVAKFAALALGNAEASGKVPMEVLLDRSGTLWPAGEPGWFTEGMAQLRNAKGLPRLFVV
jgi:hypothetical protein